MLTFKLHPALLIPSGMMNPYNFILYIQISTEWETDRINHVKHQLLQIDIAAATKTTKRFSLLKQTNNKMDTN